VTKDYLGRPLELGDYVIFMKQYARELQLGSIIHFTPSGKARVKWDNHDWAKLLQEGRQLVKVEGPDLTYFFLNQKG